MDGNVLAEEIINSGAWAVILIALSFIKIPKIEVNIWGLIGKSLTKDLVLKIDGIEKSVRDVDIKLDEHIRKEEDREATTARQRILRFNDEIINGSNHTKEHYDDMINHIDVYESYCLSHPDYSNNKCMLAIANIKDIYKKKCAKCDFEKKPTRTRKKVQK